MCFYSYDHYHRKPDQNVNPILKSLIGNILIDESDFPFQIKDHVCCKTFLCISPSMKYIKQNNK